VILPPLVFPGQTLSLSMRALKFVHCAGVLSLSFSLIGKEGVCGRALWRKREEERDREREWRETVREREGGRERGGESERECREM
jgi:hypothetical protein